MTYALIPLIIAVIAIAWLLSRRASNNRDWSLDQKILPHAEFNGDAVTIRNIRNFTYKSEDEYTPAYYDKTFNLKDLTAIYYVVEPFETWKIQMAHTFVSFEFNHKEYVAISVEIRKKKGDVFSPLRALPRQHELMYVIADERDVVKLRSNYRKDPVYVYPVKAKIEKAGALFVDMLKRANALKEKPAFYNPVTDTCTVAIVRHINNVSSNKVPWDRRLMLARDSDAFAHELGLIDDNASLEEIRERYLINERALRHVDHPDFSQKIREWRQ